VYYYLKTKNEIGNAIIDLRVWRLRAAAATAGSSCALRKRRLNFRKMGPGRWSIMIIHSNDGSLFQWPTATEGIHYDIVTDTVGDGQILGLRKAGFCPNGPLGHNPPDRVVGPQRSERGFFCQLSRTSYIRSVDDPLWCNPEWRQYMYARCKANGEKRCRSPH